MFRNADCRSLGSLIAGGGRKEQEEEGILEGKIIMSKVTEKEFSPGCEGARGETG